MIPHFKGADRPAAKTIASNKGQDRRSTVY